MFKSLYIRIAVYTIVVILFSAFISFIFTNIYYHFNLKPSNDAKIMKTLKGAKEFEDKQSFEHINTYFKHLGDMNYQIMTVDQHGNKHFYGAPFRKDSLPKHDIQKVLHGDTYHGIKEKPFKLFVTGFFDNETDNTVGLQFKNNHQAIAVFMRPDIGETFSEFRIFLAVLLALLLIISISLVIASTYSIVRPVKQLKRGTERLMNGDFNTPIKQTRKDEIGTLQYRFDTMRQSLKQVDEMRQHFVQNVSHEIKTPLTHIKQLLVDLEQTDNENKRQNKIEEINQITTQLSDLTRELLLLSELDNAQHLTFSDNIQLNILIKDIIRHEHFALDNKSLMIKSNLESIYFLGNERLLHQAINNLIINAIKYAYHDSVINITLTQTSQHILIQVTNHGDVITETQQSRMFERFYKLSHDNNSNGLGLAITESIIKLHHGKIYVSSTQQEGTTFTIQLPQN